MRTGVLGCDRRGRQRSVRRPAAVGGHLPLQQTDALLEPLQLIVVDHLGRRRCGLLAAMRLAPVMRIRLTRGRRRRLGRFARRPTALDLGWAADARCVQFVLELKRVFREVGGSVLCVPRRVLCIPRRVLIPRRQEKLRCDRSVVVCATGGLLSATNRFGDEAPANALRRIGRASLLTVVAASLRIPVRRGRTIGRTERFSGWATHDAYSY